MTIEVPAIITAIPVPATQGGTGLSSFAVGDLLYANSTTTLARRAAGTAGYVLTMSGGVPVWAAGGGGGGISIGDTVTGGTTGSILFVGAASVLAQDNASLFWDNTNDYLGVNTATPAGHVHVISDVITIGNPTASAISFTTVGASTGYAAQGIGTAYVYTIYNSKVVNGTTIYSATPASLSVTENIDPVSTSAVLLKNGSGFTPGGSSQSYKVYAIYADGKRSFTGGLVTRSLDTSPTAPVTVQNPVGAGTGYTANSQTENYTIYPMFLGLRTSSGLAAAITFDASLAQVQANISWTANALIPDDYLIVNTTTNKAALTGGVVSAIDTDDWLSYSDPGVSSNSLNIQVQWTAPPHGGMVDYYVYNQTSGLAAYVGSTALILTDSGAWSAFSDPGVTNLNFSLSWINAASTTATFAQCALLKPSNTYDFAGLATTLADDSTGWGAFVTTTPTSIPDVAVLGDGFSRFRNTLGGTETPLNAYAPGSGAHSQDWYDETGARSAYVTSDGSFHISGSGAYYGNVQGSLYGSVVGGTATLAGFSNTGNFSNASNNNAALFIDASLNASVYEYGILTTSARTSSTPLAGFGGGLKFLGQTTTTQEIGMGGIYASWRDATHATYSGMLLFGTYSAINSNNFKESLRMQIDAQGNCQNIWNAGVQGQVGNIMGGSPAGYKTLVLKQATSAAFNIFECQDSSSVQTAWIDPLGAVAGSDVWASTVSSLGSEKLTNGTFTGNATGWTLNTGWTYVTNTVKHDGNGTGTLLQTSAGMVTPLVIGQMYKLVYTMSAWTVGTLTPACGGVTLPTDDGSITNGNAQTRYFRATSAADLTFTPSNTARFTIDNISLKQVTAGAVYAAGAVEGQGAFMIGGTGATPTHALNTATASGAATATLGTTGPGGTTPAGWINMTINGTTRYIPFF